MITRWSIVTDAVQTAVWPVPVFMSIMGGVLFGAALGIDGSAPDLQGWWLHAGDGDDARNLLSTLLTAIITMSSVVFSITIVALSLAATQFGSRLIRTYMADTRTKVALGLFAMTIVYCLLGLMLLKHDMPEDEVPRVMVTVGATLGLVCVLALLLFVHRLAHAMVADEVIRRASRELGENVGALAPLVRVSQAPSDDLLPAEFERESVSVSSRDEGYVEAIDYERLTEVCAQRGLVVRLDIRAGLYIYPEGSIARACPASAVNSEASLAIQEHILIGLQRTPNQDLEFSIRHLIDIALRALSPGINDANSALVVIDHLAGSLSRLMRKALAPSVYRDEAGVVRVIGQETSYAGILDSAFHQIRQAAARHPAVIINLLDAIGRIAEHTTLPGQREALLRHARLVAAAGTRENKEQSDLEDIARALETARKRLEAAAEDSSRLSATTP